jgi:autotransporter-associated beta strand protein
MLCVITRQQVALIAAAFCVISAALCSAQDSSSSTWSGAGTNPNWSNGANWQGGTAPVSGADVTLNASSSSKGTIYLDASPSINSLMVGGNGYYWMYGTISEATLTIGSGGLTVGSPSVYYSYLYVDSSVNITLAKPQTWTIGSAPGEYGYAQLYGNITGSSANLLTVAVTQNGTLELGGSNNFSGTVTLNSGLLYVASDTALGNATLTINGNSSISSNVYTDRVVPNAVTINGGSTTLYPNYNSIVFSGPITLTRPSEIDVYGPGPVIFSGTLSETGGSQSITTAGTGMLVVTGSVGLTGGVAVNDGLMIIGSSTAVPASGSVGVYGNGYLGLDLATTSISATTFLNRLDPASTGTIGFDTATPSSPAIVNDNIDLSGFSGNPRLGSATSAIINGTITPGSGGYQFGGGGGTLQVTSNLTGENSLNLYSPWGENQSLVLILSGTNTYSGGTTIGNSLLRFSSPAALGTGDFNFSDRGYLGLDYTPAANDLENLWSRTNPNDNTVVLGFDSPNPAAPNTVTISTVTLHSLPPGAYLGTSTAATIGISQDDWPMPSNLGFAAVRNGHLTVSSLPSGSYSLILGLPNDYNDVPATNYVYDSTDRGSFATAQSTVELASANNYSGGTTLQGGSVILDNSGALGTGSIQVTGDVTLSTNTGGFTIANNISFTESVDPTLTLDATNSFTLSGAISSESYNAINKIGAGILTLSGDNSVFFGQIDISQGELDVANDHAVANADLWLYGDGTQSVSFLTAAPQVASLNGDGAVNLGSTTTLTINGNGEYDSYFYGNISGAGGIVVGRTDSSANVYFSGDNTYSGGTVVSGNSDYPSTLIAGSSTALGSGPVTVSGGSLYLSNNQVTLTNPLIFTSGTIGGLGTFAPASGVTIASNQTVAPGASSSNYFVSDNLSTAIGTLSFSTGLKFASGGTYQWLLGDATGVAGTGWDEILVTGPLTITSTSVAPFTLALSPSSSGSLVFDNTQYYNWTVASASGGITGFNPNEFTLDSSGFGDSLGTGQFSLSQNGDNLMLNFTPVPEPSIYALMGLGLGVVFVGLRRGKRRAC